MIKTAFLLGVLFCSAILSGQNLLLLSSNHTELSKGVFLKTQLGVNFRSNALDNKFMEKLVLGGHIGEENKDNVGKTLSDMNRAGGSIGMDLEYRNYTDTLFGLTSIGIFAQIQSRYDAYVAFPEDFYNIVFRGNSDYRGRSADLSGLDGRLIAYQKMGVGLFHKKSLSYASISYVAGSGYFQGQLDEAELYTSEIGDSLHLEYSGEFVQSVPATLAPYSGTWPGMALDFGINIPLENNMGHVMLHVNDFGFVKWGQELTTYAADSSVSWTGVNINDLFDSSIDELDIPLLDDSLNYSETQGSLTTWLPVSINLRLLRKMDSQGYGEFGIFLKPNGVHIPRIHAAYHYLLDDLTIVSAKATVGGYGRFRIGASFEKIMGGWFLSAGTEDLPGLLLDDLRGKGAWISIGKFFNNE